jgi:hypothetical protein
LKERAAVAGQSLSGHLLAEITRVAARPPIAEVLRKADARPGGVSIAQIVAAVRSGRDS